MKKRNIKLRILTYLSVLALTLGLSVGVVNDAVAQAFDRAKLIEGAKKEGALVLYTGLGQVDATQILKVFKEKYPFLDVNTFYAAPAGRLLSRMQAEEAAGKNVADVLSNGNIVQFHTLENKFAKFVTPEQDAYGSDVKKPGIWTAFQVTPLIIAYNSNNVTADQLPASWADLADPKWKGKLGLQTSNTGFMFIAWQALRDVMGKDYWAKVAKNEVIFHSSSQPLMEGLLRNEILLNANAGSYYVWKYGVRDGAPIKGHIPKEGAPVALSPIAVLKSAPHPNAARLFVDWALSVEGQQTMVSTLGSYSGRKDVPSPKGAQDFASIKLLVAKISDLINNREEFKKEWSKYEKRK